jgi:cytoskeletal protein RodZ
MVAVDGARSAPTTRLRRLLRQSLLVAALAAAGWLLSALFASTASAEAPAAPADQTDQHADDQTGDPSAGRPELPARPDRPARPGEPAPAGEEPAAAEQPAPPGAADDEASEGAPATAEPAHHGLGAVLGGVTNALTSVVTHVVTQTVHQVDHTVATLTSTVLGTAEQALAQDQVVAARPEQNATGIARTATAPTPVPAPRKQPAIPALPSTAVLAQNHTPRAPVATPHRTSTTPRHDADRHDAGQHADGPGRERPIDIPAPVAPGGTSVSNAHDSAGGARTTHGVLTASATLPPAAAGYTTRSRAADATGRVSGLPATSPD